MLLGFLKYFVANLIDSLSDILNLLPHQLPSMLTRKWRHITYSRIFTNTENLAHICAFEENYLEYQVEWSTSGSTCKEGDWLSTWSTEESSQANIRIIGTIHHHGSKIDDAFGKRVGALLADAPQRQPRCELPAHRPPKSNQNLRKNPWQEWSAADVSDREWTHVGTEVVSLHWSWRLAESRRDIGNLN